MGCNAALQEASGTFGYLRDVASVKVEAPRPVDVGPECCGMLAHLMLAQVSRHIMPTQPQTLPAALM